MTDTSAPSAPGAARSHSPTRRTHRLEQLAHRDGPLLAGGMSLSWATPSARSRSRRRRCARRRTARRPSSRPSGRGRRRRCRRRRRPAGAAHEADGQPLGLGAQRHDERLHAGRAGTSSPSACTASSVRSTPTCRSRTGRGRRAPPTARRSGRRRSPTAAQAVVHELERRLRVVVEAAHQLGRLGPGRRGRSGAGGRRRSAPWSSRTGGRPSAGRRRAGPTSGRCRRAPAAG